MPTIKKGTKLLLDGRKAKVAYSSGEDSFTVYFEERGHPPRILTGYEVREGIKARNSK